MQQTSLHVGEGGLHLWTEAEAIPWGRRVGVWVYVLSQLCAAKPDPVQSWLSIHTVQRSSMSLQMINKDVLLPKSHRILAFS